MDNDNLESERAESGSTTDACGQDPIIDWEWLPVEIWWLIFEHIPMRANPLNRFLYNAHAVYILYHLRKVGQRFKTTVHKDMLHLWNLLMVRGNINPNVYTIQLLAGALYERVPLPGLHIIDGQVKLFSQELNVKIFILDQTVFVNISSNGWKCEVYQPKSKSCKIIAERDKITIGQFDAADKLRHGTEYHYEYSDPVLHKLKEHKKILSGFFVDGRLKEGLKIRPAEEHGASEIKSKFQSAAFYKVQDGDITLEGEFEDFEIIEFDEVLVPVPPSSMLYYILNPRVNHWDRIVNIFLSGYDPDAPEGKYNPIVDIPKGERKREYQKFAQNLKKSKEPEPSLS